MHRSWQVARVRRPQRVAAQGAPASPRRRLPRSVSTARALAGVEAGDAFERAAAIRWRGGGGAPRRAAGSSRKALSAALCATGTSAMSRQSQLSRALRLCFAHGARGRTLSARAAANIRSQRVRGRAKWSVAPPTARLVYQRLAVVHAV